MAERIWRRPWRRSPGRHGEPGAEGDPLGSRGERCAERELRRRGWAIVARNYRCRVGEVDLIALDGRTVVFVEVKTRRSAELGDPLESVDREKQERILRAASHFLTRHRLHERAVRFDVVGVLWTADGPSCEVVPDAFGEPDVPVLERRRRRRDWW